MQACRVLYHSLSLSVLLVFILSAAVGGCAEKKTYQPAPLESIPLAERAESQSRGGLTVKASVLSPEESLLVFDLPLYERGIQPVWLHIENNQPTQVRFALVGTDSEYFSPYEVAYVHRAGFTAQSQQAMELKFYHSGMPRIIPAGESRSGFVFTHAVPGTKAFNVDLFGAQVASDQTFTFFIDVPGFEPDHSEEYLKEIYPPEQISKLTGEQLRVELKKRNLVSRDANGQQDGLPLNGVFIGEGEVILQALIRSGWMETPRPQGEDAATAQYWDNRVADVLFQRNAQDSGERNELRVWLTPYRVNDLPVWLVQTTHHIGLGEGRSVLDPDIDDATAYLLQNLWYTQTLQQFGWVQGSNGSTLEQPKQSFDGREYYSADLIAVMWFSPKTTSMLDVTVLPWDKGPIW